MSLEYLMKCLVIGIITGTLMINAINYPTLLITILFCGLLLVWNLDKLP